MLEKHQFVATVTREKEEQARLAEMAQDKRKIKGCLDELTRSLVTFEDSDDLLKKINEIYGDMNEIISNI